MINSEKMRNFRQMFDVENGVTNNQRLDRLKTILQMLGNRKQMFYSIGIKRSKNSIQTKSTSNFEVSIEFVLILNRKKLIPSSSETYLYAKWLVNVDNIVQTFWNIAKIKSNFNRIEMIQNSKQKFDR